MFGSPVFAVLATLALYLGALRVHRRWLWANPLITGAAALVGVLWALKVPYSRYRIGGDVFTYLLGPATVALAVPMYKQVQVLRRSLGRLVLVVSAGAAVGMVTAAGTAWLMGASHKFVASAVPKSVTTPIAVQVSQALGGDPAITIAMVLLTGLLGAVVGPAMLRLIGIRHEHAVGAAVGTASHAIGTASVIRQSEVQGSVSSLAMVLAGMVTSVLAMVVGWVWR